MKLHCVWGNCGQLECKSGKTFELAFSFLHSGKCMFTPHSCSPRKISPFCCIGGLCISEKEENFFDFLLLLKISKNFRVLSATLSRLWTRWATKIVDKTVLLCRCDDAMKKILGFEGRKCRKIRWNYFFWKCHKSC